MHASGTVTMTSWDETPLDAADGWPRLTRARAGNVLHGDIQGTGTLEYLLAYGDDGGAAFVGLERVVGRIGYRSGSFVLQHVGRFADRMAVATWTIVPGSGTEALTGIRGQGRFAAARGQPSPYTLDIDWD